MKRLEPRTVAFYGGPMSVTESGMALIDPLTSIDRGHKKDKKRREEKRGRKGKRKEYWSWGNKREGLGITAVGTREG